MNDHFLPWKKQLLAKLEGRQVKNDPNCKVFSFFFSYEQTSLMCVYYYDAF
jgi:hypothetical protein